MILDKGRLITKEFCEICKEIKPGETMILKAVAPSRVRLLHSRLWSSNYYGCYYKRKIRIWT